MSNIFNSESLENILLDNSRIGLFGWRKYSTDGIFTEVFMWACKLVRGIFSLSKFRQIEHSFLNCSFLIQISSTDDDLSFFFLLFPFQSSMVHLLFTSFLLIVPQNESKYHYLL